VETRLEKEAHGEEPHRDGIARGLGDVHSSTAVCERLAVTLIPRVGVCAAVFRRHRIVAVVVSQRARLGDVGRRVGDSAADDGMEGRLVLRSEVDAFKDVLLAARRPRSRVRPESGPNGALLELGQRIACKTSEGGAQDSRRMEHDMRP
jgi:hypothetical protein